MYIQKAVQRLVSLRQKLPESEFVDNVTAADMNNFYGRVAARP